MKRLISNVRRSLMAAVAVAGLALMAPAVSEAQPLTFYSTRADFDAAAPGLPVENFGAANLFGEPYITHASPISSATNDAVFAAGSILPGLTVSTLNPGLVSNALEIEGGGPGGNYVGTNWFQDTLILGFAPGVSAVGEDVLGQVYPGPGFAGTFTEEVYSGSTLLGSMDFSQAAGPAGFIGVTSTTADITSVHLLFNPTADVDSNTFVTNIAFHSASVPEPASITLSAIAAALFGLRLAVTRRRAGRPRGVQPTG